MFGRKKEKTKIIAKYDTGIPNALYLRGEGIPGLSWQKGLKMRNIKANEWELEFEATFKTAEFKILVNDKAYELGDNHKLHAGETVHIHPKF